ncbi:hypothetical protein IWQ60_005816 [Tieghemiomyces parasiticus]|uniref:Uncharacterized protein n=1 Tax=Tieghemiomyces parasiticus TaxID=78921 RepID=A0A9W8ADC3_9FUNG|nr:hypothetical protein IWQ60_005816 [Tieghemiomyces parasiticus]
MRPLAATLLALVTLYGAAGSVSSLTSRRRLPPRVQPTPTSLAATASPTTLCLGDAHRFKTYGVTLDVSLPTFVAPERTFMYALTQSDLCYELVQVAESLPNTVYVRVDPLYMKSLAQMPFVIGVQEGLSGGGTFF